MRTCRFEHYFISLAFMHTVCPYSYFVVISSHRCCFAKVRGISCQYNRQKWNGNQNQKNLFCYDTAALSANWAKYPRLVHLSESIYFLYKCVVIGLMTQRLLTRFLLILCLGVSFHQLTSLCVRIWACQPSIAFDLFTAQQNNRIQQFLLLIYILCIL